MPSQPTTLPALPYVERAADCEAHRAALLADLAPEGALEAALAERPALLLWRLDRVAPSEHALLAHAQERAEWDLSQRRAAVGVAPDRPNVEHPDDVRSTVRWQAAALALLEQLPALDDAAPLPSEAVDEALDVLAETAIVKLAKLPAFRPPAGAEPDDPPWTAGRLRAAIDALAAAALYPTVFRLPPAE